jgi:hypothetical protein
MKINSLLAATFLAASTAGSFAATPVALSLDPSDGTLNGTFSGIASGEAFEFLVSAGSSLDVASITSTYTSKTVAGAVKTGFHISQILFDGGDVAALTKPGTNSPIAFSIGTVKAPNYNNFDNWSFAVDNLSDGLHTITVQGLGGSPNGGFNGLVVLTPAVPEPQTLALMLAGLGAVGFLARRRKPD